MGEVAGAEDFDAVEAVEAVNALFGRGAEGDGSVVSGFLRQLYHAGGIIAKRVGNAMDGNAQF